MTMKISPILSNTETVSDLLLFLKYRNSPFRFHFVVLK